MSTQLAGKRIAVLGVGTLGRALAEGLVESAGVDPAALVGTVRRAERLQALAAAARYRVTLDNAQAARDADVVLVCTKPKDAPGVVSELAAAGALDHDPLLVSVAAGVTTDALLAAAGREQRIVRAMPNTPCLIGEGMTVLSPGRHATPLDGELALALFEPLGRVLVLDEEHLNTVTGLSGSGPAFIYVVIEALAEGGVMCGLPREVATELAAQSARGAASMVLDTERHPASLKDDVTTPAGCTIAGLLAMEDGRIRSVLARGVEAAARAAAGLGPGEQREA